MTLSHILTLGAFGELFSDPKLAKRLSWCLLTPYLPPINPIKYLRGQNVLIAPQQAKTKPVVEVLTAAAVGTLIEIDMLEGGRAATGL
jgi:hypothetical protein